jgi:hypothetical protein
MIGVGLLYRVIFCEMKGGDKLTLLQQQMHWLKISDRLKTQQQRAYQRKCLLSHCEVVSNEVEELQKI